MKRIRNKTYFKIGILLLTSSLFLYNCQKEDFFVKTTEASITQSKKYNLERLDAKELKEDTEIARVLHNIQGRFKSHMTNHSHTERSVVVGDGLVILDDEVAKITTINTITWTFKVETPTHESSVIENFMIKKHDDVFSYYLIKYTQNDQRGDNPYIATLEQINGAALDTSDIDLSSRDAFDWEFGDGGGDGEDCQGIVIGYTFYPCSEGGHHTAGTYCCQHVGAPHGCQTTSGFCGFTCSGTSEVEILDFSHCDSSTGDPVDGSNDNPNDDQIGGGSGGSDSGGDDGNDDTVTTLVDPRCLPLDSGKIFINGVCVCPFGYRENDEGKCVLDDCNTTKEDLKKVFPNGSDQELSIFADLINQKGKDLGINTKEKLQHFLAQVGHETGGLNTLNVRESLNYSTASLIPKTYSKFTMDTVANPTKLYAGHYVNDEQKLANVVMCCDYENGSVSSGDGWRYRGRGILQLTWKENYRRFKEWYNANHDPDLDFVANPDLISTNDTLSILSGLWYFKARVLNRIPNLDRNTSVKNVTIKINGGEHGLPDRKQRFQVAKDSINCIN